MSAAPPSLVLKRVASERSGATGVKGWLLLPCSGGSADDVGAGLGVGTTERAVSGFVGMETGSV